MQFRGLSSSFIHHCNHFKRLINLPSWSVSTFTKQSGILAQNLPNLDLTRTNTSWTGIIRWGKFMLLMSLSPRQIWLEERKLLVVRARSVKIALFANVFLYFRKHFRNVYLYVSSCQYLAFSHCAAKLYDLLTWESETISAYYRVKSLILLSISPTLAQQHI